MRLLSTLLLFISFNVFADVSLNVNTVKYMDALQDCVVGKYYEPNHIIKYTGSKLLEHEIVSYQDNICTVYMQTPDGRTFDCAFDDYDLFELQDQVMLEGLFSYNKDKPTNKSLRAMHQWSMIKTRSCGIY